jgi:hypothetical protein
MTEAKSNLWETAVLLLIFNNTVATAVIAGIGSGILASTTAGSLFIQLHVGTVVDATATQDLQTPMTYTGYLGPLSVARATSGWTVAAQNASNAGLLQFGNNTGSSQTAATVSIGNNTTPSISEILYYGNAALVVSPGVNPQYAIGALDIDET